MNRCAVLGLCLLGYAGYLLLGALLVSAIERPYESRLRAELRSLKAAFLRASPCLNESALERFLERVLSANRYGVSVLRNGSAGASSWDFASAFFFSSTLVTTVGKRPLPPPLRAPSPAGAPPCPAGAPPSAARRPPQLPPPGQPPPNSA